MNVEMISNQVNILYQVGSNTWLLILNELDLSIINQFKSSVVTSQFLPILWYGSNYLIPVISNNGVLIEASDPTFTTLNPLSFTSSNLMISSNPTYFTSTLTSNPSYPAALSLSFTTTFPETS